MKKQKFAIMALSVVVSFALESVSFAAIYGQKRHRAVEAENSAGIGCNLDPAAKLRSAEEVSGKSSSEQLSRPSAVSSK